ncbi:MAG: hypothetical protein Ct9H300mP3_11650 [Gammaproteobacteria bacterium]|nr:MAG: hypothetical protein Ct9H300mP3_11650 [Gammaproteobacteria bacterium]
MGVREASLACTRLSKVFSPNSMSCVPGTPLTLQRGWTDLAKYSLSSGVLYMSSMENPILLFLQPFLRTNCTNSDRVVFPEP